MNISNRSAWRPVLSALVLAALAFAQPAMARQAASAPAAGKPRIAIRSIAATPAVTLQAKADGSENALAQVEQGADVQFLNAIQASGRFDVVARADLPSILKEQDLTQSGNANVMDPQAARGFQLAGARYVITVTIGNFQEVVEKTELLNQFGKSKAERRTINLQAVVKIFDSTSGALYRSTALTLSDVATNEILPEVEQKGVKTNVVLGTVAEKLATQATAAIVDSLAPARVIGYTMGQVTFNRSATNGVAAGQIYELFAPGSAMVDPDTGEQLGAEEVHVGWARVTDAGTRFSTAQAIEDRGIDRGSMLRLRPQGLPAGIDPNTGLPVIAEGSHEPAGARRAVRATTQSSATDKPATGIVEPRGDDEPRGALTVTLATSDIADDAAHANMEPLRQGA